MINLISVSDTETDELRWEGAFNAISSDLNVKYIQDSAPTCAYIVIQLLSPCLRIQLVIN